MGLEVSGKDVEELVDEHSDESIAEELQGLHLEVQQMPFSKIKDSLIFSNFSTQLGD